MDVINGIVAYLNANSPVVIAIAATLAVMFQYLINRYASVGKLANYFIGLVGLPGILGAVATVGTTFPPKYAPIIAIVGQLLYAVYENLKARIAASAVTAVPVSPDVLGPGV